MKCRSSCGQSDPKPHHFTGQSMHQKEEPVFAAALENNRRSFWRWASFLGISKHLCKFDLNVGKKKPMLMTDDTTVCYVVKHNDFPGWLPLSFRARGHRSQINPSTGPMRSSKPTFPQGVGFPRSTDRPVMHAF